MPSITSAEGDIGGQVRTTETNISSDLDDVLRAYDFHFDPLVPTTDQRLREALDSILVRSNTHPAAVQPWECRVGLSKFQIPPTNINVSKTFKSGGMTGAAIRQESTPKINTGHTETQIQMTLIFSNYEQIWGFNDNIFEIDFENDPDWKIDDFASSLRGLIAQFRYMPILPVRNDYLNKAHNITAVCMSDLSISSLEDYPHAIAASLTMLKFNHKVYMPMVEHLDQGVHFGRARQMFGRAAWKLTNESRPVVSFGSVDEVNRTTLDDQDYRPSIRTAEDVLSDYYADGVPQDHQYTRHSYQEARSIDFYYPFHSPTDIHLPSIDEIAIEGEEFEEEGRSWWQRMMGVLGFSTEREGTQYERVKRFAESQGYAQKRDNEYTTLLDWLENVNQSIEYMSTGSLEDYISQRLDELNIEEGTNQAEELRDEIESAWLVSLYNRMMEDPSFARALAFDRQRGRDMAIREWEIPMVRLNLDPSVVHIDTVAVNRGNKFAPLQLQMEDEPTYQHIGGKDATVEIQMTLEGQNADEELVKLRTMFETISGLARLNHGYGVVGFLGIQSQMTELASLRYVMPLQFDCETIPDYPNAYSVTILLTDFDIFQQKREMLSLKQQAELVEAFGKRNPFLRIKQLWSAFNVAPDLPLTVRDDEGAVIGHLDPDFYFRQFSTIDDDLSDYYNPDSTQEPQTSGPPGPPPTQKNYGLPTTSAGSDGHDDSVHVALGRFDDNDEYLSLSSGAIDLTSGDNKVVNQGRFHDATAADTNKEPFAEGLSPASRHVTPNFSRDDPSSQFHAMIKDEQHRDQKGRMVRAFPTYMLWLIDEGGFSAGVRMFDNFYGLQSVLDFSIVQSEDILGDTLVLRISNSYSRMSTQFKDYVDDERFGGRLINEFTQAMQRTLTGLHEYLVDLDSISLQPGVRVHMRTGFSSNPNRLDTVFNGVVTDVQHGEVMTITCQSDAIELGTIVNGTDEEQSTGSHGGGFVGMYLSEPRDLMLSLLTQGTSNTREWLAHATRGRIFSENRFGIKHFGTILYEPMNQAEHARIEKRASKIAESASQSASFSNRVGMVKSLVSFSALELTQALWENLQARRDFECFKRNIYPGNGIGVGQYAGGDLGDIGLFNAMDGAAMLTDRTGLDPDDPDLFKYETDRDPRQIVRQAINEEGLANPPSDHEPEGDSGFWLPAPLHSSYVPSGMSDVVGKLFRSLGVTHEFEDDEVVDEVSFRASTYMKTVWDLFQLCAALLPDYIVAVRPFEERSTVFYGKPHWLYTSGVIPLTSGTGVNDGPSVVEPDEEADRIRQKIKKEVESKDQADPFDQMFDEIAQRSQHGKYFLSSPNNSSQEGGAGSAIEDIWEEGVQNNIPVLERFMHGVRQAESGGDYNAESDISSASGAYQYLDGTWNNYEGYARAKHAPPEIQDERARNDFARVFKQYGDWRKVAAYHFRGPGWLQKNPNVSSGAWDKNVAGQGRAITTREHIEKMLREAHITNFTDGGNLESDAAIEPGTGRRSTPGTGGSNASTGWESRMRREHEKDMQEQFNEKWKENVSVDEQAKFVFENGWKEQSIPVNSSGDENINDPVGEAASQLYEDHRSEDFADEIWQNFRSFFTADNEDVRETFKASSAMQELSEDEAEQVADDVLEELVEEFKRFCWQNAAARGWVVRVANRRLNIVDTLGEDVFGGIPFIGGGSVTELWSMVKDTDSSDVANVAEGFGAAGSLFGLARNHFDWFEREESEEDGGDVSDFIMQMLGTSGSDRTEDSGFIYDWIVDPEDQQMWSFGAVYDAFGTFLSGGPQAALQHMREESAPGRDQGGLRSRAAETLGSGISSVLEPMTQVWDALGTVFTSVISTVRLNMFQLSQGLSMSSQATQRSAIINKVHNDSIYYNAGISDAGRIENQLLNLSDNPFSREYGEPVVEIREPFQRMHTIGSFQDIISNNMIANAAGVSTVVTATSNGKHPVTVHFDKAAPAHYQRETQVDTGLLWDKPEGWVDAVTSPMDTLRSIATGLGIGRASDGVGDEISAKRVASWHLKQNLKDIYGGEIVVAGDSSIRPHDLVYMNDVFTSTMGFFECEQVVHHFTPETGFITSITPNAVVTVNDPARFSFLSHWRGQKNIQQVRNHIRQSLNVPDSAVSEDESLEIGQVLNQVESEMENSLQFTGGKNALMASLAGALGSGTLTGAAGAQITSSVAAGAGLAGAGIFGGLVWKGWEWIRDNLLDQHAAYIQYLTHKGQPLDAGLSQTHKSNAVGMQHGFSIVAAGMKLGPIPVLGPDNSPVIRTSDVVHKIQWDEYGPNESAQEVSMFIEETKRRVHQLSNAEPEGSPDLEGEIYIGTVESVVDGQTFEFTVMSQVPHDDLDYNSGTLGGSVMQVQLAGVRIPEDPVRDNRELRSFDAPWTGTLASHYTTQELEGEVVALRVVVDAGRVDDQGNIQAYVFHNAPEGLSGDDRNHFLVGAAGGWPHVRWDSYMGDGQPYTFNWQIVTDGYGTVDVSELRREGV